MKFLVNKKKCFISKKTIWKTQQYFSFSFFSSPQKTIEKTKNSLFDQNYSEIINSMNFIIFLFQSDKNDEINNLRMNEINWKQLILFNLIVLNESLFLLNWVFQLMNFIVSSDSFFSTWGIPLNYQRDESESSNFIAIFFSVRWEDNHLSNESSISMKWNDNWFIIEFFFQFLYWMNYLNWKSTSSWIEKF